MIYFLIDEILEILTQKQTNRAIHLFPSRICNLPHMY